MPLSRMLNSTFAMPNIIDSHDMGLRTVLQSRRPKINAYSTPDEGERILRKDLAGVSSQRCCIWQMLCKLISSKVANGLSGSEFALARVGDLFWLEGHIVGGYRRGEGGF
ncbi:hypothetical protein TNCV_2879841 [Trichonephila clavipes]|uniref:Uncharacterized protein n=1 Tax=Trichonephila clavipes TaxID=2585209 RepID=A0A8X7BC89_TRICX|nr:hypothetical protein TNCV_2879841 [Trichonephila clavipes]